MLRYFRRRTQQRPGLIRPIVVVIEAVAVGGMESIAMTAAIELHAQGHPLVAVVPPGPTYDVMADRLAAASVEHRRIQASATMGRIAQARGAWELFQLLRRERARVVHLHCGGTYGGGFANLACIAACVPVVVTEHTPPSPAHRLSIRVARVPLERTAWAFVSVSEPNARLRALHPGAVRPARMAYVINGIPSVPPEVAAAWRRAERRALGYAETHVVIGSAAQFLGHKRLDDLLRASALLDDALPWRVLLVGDGPDRELLESLVDELGIRERVTFTGFLADAKPAIAAMDVFVLPQAEGSMSTSVLEAMDLSVASVISHGGPGEAVIDGETGRWAPPGDVAGLTDVLDSLVRDPQQRQRLSEKGRSHVREYFSAARMGADYLELYEAAASGAAIPERLRAKSVVAESSAVGQSRGMRLRPRVGMSWREWFTSGIRWWLLGGRRPQLHMVYRAAEPPAMPGLPPNITLRTFEPGDEDAWIDLLNRNGELGQWDRARLDDENRTMVPSGVFFACDGERLVATSGVQDRPHRGEPAWEIGWVARDPEYARMWLGEAVTVASVRAALALEPREIFLKTDDHRLAAIKVYRKLGFLRVANSRGYRKRWRAVAQATEAASQHSPVE